MLGRHLAVVSLASFTLALSACSSSSDAAKPAAATDDGVVGDIRQSVTWQDGTHLSGVVRIVEGVTVDIAPGAKITCSPAVQIQIGGTLHVAAGASRANISCAAWTGLLVAENGSVDVDGLDMDGPEVGIETTKGAGTVSLKNSSITTSVRPFTIRAGSKLSLDHVKLAVPATIGPADSSVAEVFGSLDAKFIEYDSNTNEGIMVKDGGDATIADSTLISKNGLDLVSSYAGKSVTVSYTTMVGAHCGLHMQGVGQLTVNHVTSTQNIYGITIYGADNAAITDSNLGGSVAWLDLQGQHGPVSFNGVFHTGNGIIMNTDQPTDAAAATATIPAAVPRAN